MSKNLVPPLVEFLAQYPPSTSETYERVIRDLVERTGCDPLTATQTDIATYRRAINTQAAATVHKKLSCLRSLFDYLVRRNIRTDDPTRAERMPKLNSLKTVKYLTVEEVKAVMDGFGDDCKSIRDRAIIAVLLHGLRLSELVGLNVEDYREQALVIHGKGDKTRYVPLTPIAQGMLERYIDVRRSGPLFLSMFAGGGRVEARAIRKMVYEVTARAGRRMHPHALRHTCGTLTYRATRDLAAVQELLGHQNPQTTRVYTHLDLSDVRRAVEATPLLGETTPLRIVEGAA